MRTVPFISGLIPRLWNKTGKRLPNHELHIYMLFGWDNTGLGILCNTFGRHLLSPWESMKFCIISSSATFM